MKAPMPEKSLQLTIVSLSAAAAASPAMVATKPTMSCLFMTYHKSVTIQKSAVASSGTKIQTSVTAKSSVIVHTTITTSAGGSKSKQIKIKNSMVKNPFKGEAEDCHLRRAAELLIAGNDENRRKFIFFKIKSVLNFYRLEKILGRSYPSPPGLKYSQSAATTTI
ncbi:Hypothetical protein CINCED_3A008284 [Cinara cedri]|uniref:Uncharacterized protein n=1 Tax=Cinara cedri TaxID=506608 RepID=A0A5E4M230_9HEMI|nr:Hypothetical protein CINCED_3A008284 [Cinara cedri]